MPVQLNRYGKAIAVTKEPIFPAIFMAAETVPEYDLPMSMQNDQEGLSVMSAPKTATDKDITEIKRLSEIKIPPIPITTNTNPIIAGTERDLLQPSLIYNTSTSQPENKLPKTPKINGSIE